MSDTCPHCSNTIQWCLCDDDYLSEEEYGEWIDKVRDFHKEAAEQKKDLIRRGHCPTHLVVNCDCPYMKLRSKTEKLEKDLRDSQAEAAHFNAALEIASKFWREESNRNNRFRKGLETIASGEVELGQYGEMIQAVQEFAQEVLDG